jgi:hypothetical protein
VTKNTEPSSLDDDKQAKSGVSISLDDEPVNDGELTDEELLSDDSAPVKKAQKNPRIPGMAARIHSLPTPPLQKIQRPAPWRKMYPLLTPSPISNLRSIKIGSDIILSSTRKPTFTPSQSTSTNQFVYILDNAETGEKLQRAYDTSEFRSPVAMFTLFQVPVPCLPCPS